MYNFYQSLEIIPEVYNSATLQDNTDHSGGLTIDWFAATNEEIPLGATVDYHGVKYVMMEPYAPKENTMHTWHYTPTFSHPLAILNRIPFYIMGTDSEGHPVEMHTVPFTGYPYVIAQNLAAFFSLYASRDQFFNDVVGGGWTTNIESTPIQTAIITVNFDGNSIKTAADAIADALGCNVFFDFATKTIRFIAGTTIEGESYNCFHVLGGTRNMGKATISGGYAAVTQRLTLPAAEYPGSIIDRRPNNTGIILVNEICLDDIYPKMELYISYVHERVCYLTDDDGNKIVDHYEKNNVVVDEGTEGAVAVYKTFSKWYIRLSTDSAGTTPYQFNKNQLINDKPLTLLFQPNYGEVNDNESTSPLVGREFELTWFEQPTKEWSTNDVVTRDQAYQTQANEYRIHFVAEGDIILPTTSADGLIPHIGNKVTLINVALGNAEKSRAQGELATAAEWIADLYSARVAEYTGFAALSYGSLPQIGSTYTVNGHNGVVIALSYNVDTGEAQITVGSWGRKGFTSGIHDKIDTVSVTTGGSTEKEESASSYDFGTLMRTVGKVNIEDVVTPMNQRMDEIEAQADRAFNIWFGNGVPDDDGYPASQWTTDEEKELHLHDIYYNTVWNGSVSNGGYFYRYQKDENNEYGWEVVTDLATIAAMSQATTALETANGKTTVFVGSTLPTPPYKVGDLWWKTDSTGTSGTMYRSTTAKVEGNSPAMSDWTATVIPSESIINALLEFATTFEGNGGSSLLQSAVSAGGNHITVWFRDSADNSIGNNYDLLCTSSQVYTKANGTWGTSWGHESSVLSVLKRINTLGSGVFTEFRIWKGMDISQAQYKLFDLYFVRSSFDDRLLGQDVQGGLGVWVYGTQGWELLQDNTTSLQQNYGNLLRNVIFGTDQGTDTASGIVTMKNFTEIFASAEAGDTTALAAIRTLVELDSEGNPTGYVNIEADKMIVGILKNNPSLMDCFVVERVPESDAYYNRGKRTLRLVGDYNNLVEIFPYRSSNYWEDDSDDDLIPQTRDREELYEEGRIVLTSIYREFLFDDPIIKKTIITPNSISVGEGGSFNLGSESGKSGTFNAIGKQIIVKGGIITSILNGGATLPTKLSDLTDDLGNSPTHTHSQYLTSLGNRPSVALTDGTPLGSNYAIYLPLTSQGGGGYKLVLPTKLSDLTDDLGSSPTHTHSQYLTSLPSHNHDTRYYISNGTIYLGSNSITPITSSNIGSQSVASSKHVKPYATITNKGIGKTVAWVKNWIAEQFENVEDGVGANVAVSFDALNYWNTTNHVVTDANMYTFIKLSGYYSGATYGQWLLSSFDDCEVGIVGRNESAWGSIHWLATKDWVTDNFQAKASDIRKKNLDGDVKMTVEDIAAMSAVRFTWKDKRDEKVHVGTIAQDWMEKLPEVVSEDKEGYLSMDYASTALVSTIITAREVTEHEKRIQSLEDENAQLRKEIEELKELIKSKL